jgi:hypothetical protein
VRNLKILIVGSEIRTELGLAASLKFLGFNVTYLHIGKSFRRSKIEALTDQGYVKIDYLEIRNPSYIDLMRKRTYIPKEIMSKDYNLIIANPNMPYHIASSIRGNMLIGRVKRIPIILRLWGIRANKLWEYSVLAGHYREIAVYMASILHNIYQMLSADLTIALDKSTYKFAQKIYPFKHKLELIYPTYAGIMDSSIYDNKIINNMIQEIIEKNYQNYVFSFISLGKMGPLYNLEKLYLKIMYLVAKKNPDIYVIIAGGHIEDARRAVLSMCPKIYSLLDEDLEI